MFLYNLLISPIEMIIDWIYIFISGRFGLLGTFGTIYFVSVAVNLLALPLYNKADHLQEKEKAVIQKLDPMVKHIKSSFKGSEQFMMLQTYYKENNYHPLYTLRGSLSILIEIPLFIAAYHYLNNALLTDTDTWWIFKSFSSPDHLFSFTLFGHLITLNILPIIMTLINYISGFIYTRKSGVRDKVQVYVLGAIFLVLLYNSPSGLVAYWILNNLFSLGKNIVQKSKHPSEVLGCYLGLHIVAYGVLSIMFLYSKTFNWLVILLGLVVITLSILNCLSSFRDSRSKIKKDFQNNLSKYKCFTLVQISVQDVSNKCLSLLLISGLGLALLSGLLLPVNTIATSPTEFSFIGNTPSPLSYVYTSLFVFLGCFVIWPFLIFKMYGNKTRLYETLILFTMFITSLFNAFVFVSDYGKISTMFQVKDGVVLSNVGVLKHILSILCLVVTIFIFIILIKKNKGSVLFFIVLSISLVSVGISVYKIKYINERFKKLSETIGIDKTVTTDDILEKKFTLSKNNKNYIVFFLDTAINPFLPYIFEEHPEIKDKFNGFIYYPNTVSYSAGTVTGTPPMLGGYEYTPQRINERSDELLVDKHNEASSVLPTLFANAGYEVALADMPWANYSSRADYDVFGGIPNTKAFELYGAYTDRYLEEKKLDLSEGVDDSVRKEVRNFSVIQMSFPVFRDIINKKLRRINVHGDEVVFVNNFSELYYLREITKVEDTMGQYIFIGNNTTHDPTYLDDTYTIPVLRSDTVKTPFDDKDTQTIIRYQALVASLKQIGLYLDYLRENNVYNNTRIVIVADHGAISTINKDIKFPKTSFMPLLMFKDFNSNEEVKTSETFMTNADMLFLLIQDQGDISHVNPFTNKQFKEDKENGVETVVTYETNAETLKNKKSKQYHFETNSYAKKIKNGSLSDPANWE